jgi:hypothetical protein
MRFFIVALTAASFFFMTPQAFADHYGVASKTSCASKKYRSVHQKKCRHWGTHHHHGIHLEGGH